MSGDSRLTALKRFARSTSEDIAEARNWAVALHMFESDRTVVISYGAILEDSVRFSLERRMRIDSASQRRDLFENMAPLATFSAKIKMAYALRIFGPKVRKSIDSIREIRNAFAHCKRDIGFKTAEVHAVIEMLQYPDTTLASMTDDKLKFKTCSNTIAAALDAAEKLDSQARLIVLP